jgi:hypothetical protein
MSGSEKPPVNITTAGTVVVKACLTPTMNFVALCHATPRVLNNF